MTTMILYHRWLDGNKRSLLFYNMKHRVLKEILYLFFAVTLVLVTLISCAKNEKENSTNEKSIFNLEENMNKKRVGVAYFSFDDDVKDVALKFKEVMDADIFEIEPVEPYKETDMNYDDKNSRIYLEDEFDPFNSTSVVFDDEFDGFDAIPKETENQVDNREKLTELPRIKRNGANNCQIIILGFPVWYENAPKVIYSFLKGMKNKIIIPFCTNGDMGMIDQYLSNYVDSSVRVMSGKGFDKDVSLEELKKWITILSADFDLK